MGIRYDDRRERFGRGVSLFEIRRLCIRWENPAHGLVEIGLGGGAERFVSELEG